MRSDKVENGVNFLVHPKVKTAPLSQRISFLENKGLTSEEISAALARVEAQGDNKSLEGKSSWGGTNSNSLVPEQDVPLWRKLVVPGAVALGAVGALGTYHAAARAAASSSNAVSRSEISNNQQQEQTLARTNGNEYASCNGGVTGGSHNDTHVRDIRDGNEGVDEGLDYNREGFVPRALNSGTSYVGGVDEGNTEGSGRSVALINDSASHLAGEFRRLSEAMKQQTGQLVEAVGAMKSLASRAEHDSSNLLAARVNSHTSELRAELGTIKQLLLLQAGQGTGAGAGGGVATGALASTESGASVSGIVAAGTVESATPRPGIGPGNGGERITTAGSLNVAAARNVQNPNGSSRPTDVARTGGKGQAATRPHEDGATTGDTAQQPLEQAAIVARRTEAARSALSSLLATNAPQPAKDGIAMLRMLVNNLVKQPNVPRYRRIAASNDNFKKRVLPLEGHRAMMEAIGFKAKGSLWEWTWHEDSDPTTFDTNKTVLESVMAAIDAAAKPNGPPSSSSASSLTTTWPPQPGFSTAGASSVVSAAPRGTVAASPAAPRPPTSLHTTHATHSLQGPQSNTLDHSSNQTAAEANGSVWTSVPVPAGITGAAAGGGQTENLRALSGRVNGDMAGPTFSGASSPAVPVVAVNGEKAGASSTMESSDSLIKDHEHAQRLPAAAVPAESEMKGASGAGFKEHREDGEAEGGEGGGNEKKEVSTRISMAELAAAIQRGEEPPGIRRVEDRLSADASVLKSTSSLTRSPPKPWETLSTSQTVSLGAVASADGIGGGGSGDIGESVNDEGGTPLKPSTPSSLPLQSPQRPVSVGP